MKLFCKALSIAVLTITSLTIVAFADTTDEIAVKQVCSEYAVADRLTCKDSGLRGTSLADCIDVANQDRKTCIANGGIDPSDQCVALCDSDLEAANTACLSTFNDDFSACNGDAFCEIVAEEDKINCTNTASSNHFACVQNCQQ